MATVEFFGEIDLVFVCFSCSFSKNILPGVGPNEATRVEMRIRPSSFRGKFHRQIALGTAHPPPNALQDCRRRNCVFRVLCRLLAAGTGFERHNRVLEPELCHLPMRNRFSSFDASMIV